MFSLTFRQLQLHQFLRQRIAATGTAPNSLEIARALSFNSTHTVEQQLKQLEAAHAIEWLPGSRPQLRVLELPTEVGLPLVGRLGGGRAAPAWFGPMLYSLTH